MSGACINDNNDTSLPYYGIYFDIKSFIKIIDNVCPQLVFQVSLIFVSKARAYQSGARRKPSDVEHPTVVKSLAGLKVEPANVRIVMKKNIGNKYFRGLHRKSFRDLLNSIMQKASVFVQAINKDDSLLPYIINYFSKKFYDTDPDVTDDEAK